MIETTLEPQELFMRCFIIAACAAALLTLVWSAFDSDKWNY